MTTTHDHHYVADTATTEEFAQLMTATIDAASVAILTSIGHQTGLFDTMATLPPATSTHIADAAGLNERYVREWLGGLTATGMIAYDSVTASYFLPREYAAVLTRAAGPGNLARVTQFIPLLGEVEQKIIGCFRNGGGLSYEEYPRFHATMAEMSGEVFDAALVDVVLPMAAGVPGRLAAGAQVADFGCGSGCAVNIMAEAFPASRFTGIDFSEQSLAVGAAEAASRGLSNATFECRDVAQTDVIEAHMTEAYDVITAFDAIHDQAQPATVLANIYRALRPGGTFLMVDIRASSRVEDNIGVPLAPYMYTVSTMHCMSVSFGLDGDGLGTVWGRQLAESMLAEAGFTGITVHEIDSDPVNLYYVAHK